MFAPAFVSRKRWAKPSTAFVSDPIKRPFLKLPISPRVNWSFGNPKMSTRFNSVVRRLRRYQRTLRQTRMVAKAIKSKHHPILAHIIPMRRCNLSCAYCNEYDKVSDPVPTAEMLRRIEILAGMGTGIITISGGEPLLHPELDQIIAAIRSHRA